MIASQIQRRIRAVFYISAYFPNPLGAAFAARTLARGLRDQGVDIEFVVDEKSGDWSRGGHYEGFPIQSFSLSQPGKLKKLKGLYGVTRYALSRRGHLDLVHIHGGDFVTIFVGFWLGKLSGAKVLLKITSDGWDTPDGIQRSRYGWLVSRIYRRLDGIVAMTSGQTKKLREWGYKGCLATIPNGVNTERFVPVTKEERAGIRKDLAIPEEAPVICFSGWMGKGKGSDILFQAWNLIRGEIPETRLLLLGNFFHTAKQREAFEKWLKEAGVDPAIMKDPYLMNVGITKEPERYLAAADVFLFPSRQEGFGTVQIEAMACGLPCIVHDIPGVSRDIFPDSRVGICLPKNNPDDFSRETLNLLNDPYRREQISAAARERVEQKYKAGFVAEAYCRLYGELLHGR